MNDNALMQSKTPTPRSTLVGRASAVSIGVVLGSVAMPALATPSTWVEPDNPSLIGALIQIGGPVLAILALLALLTYLPSMMGRGGSRENAHRDPEWFGGPRTGVKADETGATEGSGGSGARW
jgi:hypothetical protein